jgi:hypothetical protein
MHAVPVERFFTAVTGKYLLYREAKVAAASSSDIGPMIRSAEHLFVRSVDARAPKTVPPVTSARSAVIIKLISSTLTEFGRALGGKGVH